MIAVVHDDLVLSPVADIETVRTEWTSLALEGRNVFGTWEWADAWRRHLAPRGELAVAVARRPTGIAAAILPLWVARRRPCRLVRFIGAGPADRLGPVCARAQQAPAHLALKRHLDSVLAGSGLFVGERLSACDCGGDIPGAALVARNASPLLSLGAGGFEAFLASRSRHFRNHVRRQERTIMRAGRLVYRLTQDADELGRDMHTLLALHGARWAGQRTTALSGPRAKFHLDFAQTALPNGWLRLWTLELDGQPLASYYGLRFAGSELYYQMGRDPAYDRLSVGFVLLCHAIRSAAEDGVREYAFGVGDEEYKSRFTDHDPGVRTIALAAGLAGKTALAALRAVLELPAGARRVAWRLSGR